MPKIFNKKRMKGLRQELRGRMPQAELVLWNQLRGQALGFKFRRQHGIGSFVVDFYCPKAKLVLEIDGDSHFEDGVAEYDQKRQRYIERLGIRVLRFTNNDVLESLDAVVEKITEALQPPLTPPSEGGGYERTT
jgi:very-short-patch-repair endonuclease